MTGPKKHHYVPQFLLRHFGNDKGRLRVHRTDRDHSYLAHARDLGHTNFGHSLYWPNREPDHVTIEAGMCEIEGAAAKVIAEIRTNKSRRIPPGGREVLGFLIALQWERSRFFLDMLDVRVLDPDKPVDELGKSIGARQILSSLLAPWAARAAGESDPKEVFCYVVDWLEHGPWTWRLYRPNAPRLLVGDNLVCMWDVADEETSQMPAPWTHHGVSLGFGNCARITMPLAPDLGLIISRTGQQHDHPVSAAAFNQATIYNSREFVAHHPDGLPTSALESGLDGDIRSQRMILPIIREATRRAAEQDRQEYERRRRNEGHDLDQPF